MTSRTAILEQAAKIVSGQREQDYGRPENNFGLIARLWNTYLGPIWQTDDPMIYEEDVAIMMCLMKIARLSSGRYHPDNFVDLAGYAALAGELASLKQEELESMAERLRIQAEHPEKNGGVDWA